MEKYLYCFVVAGFSLLLTITHHAFSQQKTTTFTIQGEVLDSEEETALNYTSVTLLRASDSTTVSGGYTGEDGRFVLSAKEADLLLRISHLGYQPQVLQVHRASNKTSIDVGKIRLESHDNILKGLTVTAEEKAMYEYDTDSTVFNVPEGFEEGGSAQDVLEYTPSLTMDEDGTNIRVKGKSISGVYIDNKRVSELGFNAQEYLQNTPAFMIEKVTILRTPPDPEDAAKLLTSGVTDNYYLNIMTRKIRFRGYNAAITSGLNSRNRQLVRTRFNMNLDPFQLNYNNNLQGVSDSTYLHRTNFLENGDSSVLDQNKYSRNSNFSQNLNARYTFQFTEEERLRLRSNIGWNNSRSDRNDISQIANPQKEENRNREQRNKNHANGYNMNVNGDYRKEYDKEGKKVLTAALNIRQRQSNSLRNAIGAYLIKGDTLLQRNEGSRSSAGLRSRLMYKNSFGNEDKHFFQVNGSFSTDNNHNLNDVSRSDTSSSSSSSSELHSNRRMSSNYFGNGESYSALFMIGKRDKKLGWIAATNISNNDNHNHDDYRKNEVNRHVLTSQNTLGANYSFKEGQVLNLNFNPGIRFYRQNIKPNDTLDWVSYKYTNFIPGVSAKYQTKVQRVTFNYERKLRMPNWNQLNPYVENSDPLNIRTGNPNLRPVSTNEYRLGYEYNREVFFASLRLSDVASKDVITAYRSIDKQGISTRTFVNLKEQKRRSANLNAGVHYFKNITDWDATINLNTSGGISVYSMKSDDEHVGKDFRNVSGITSNFKALLSLKYKVVSLNMNGRYTGPRYLTQGKLPSRFGSGLHTKVSLLQHSLNVSLGVENIFGASVRQNFYKTDRYTQYSSNRKNIRFYSLYITYQFKSYKKLDDS